MWFQFCIVKIKIEQCFVLGCISTITVHIDSWWIQSWYDLKCQSLCSQLKVNSRQKYSTESKRGQIRMNRSICSSSIIKQFQILWIYITNQSLLLLSTALNFLLFIELRNTCQCIYHHHQLELVGDVAVPVSVRQAVLFWALRSPDARPRLTNSAYNKQLLVIVSLFSGPLYLHVATSEMRLSECRVGLEEQEY